MTTGQQPCWTRGRCTSSVDTDRYTIVVGRRRYKAHDAQSREKGYDVGVGVSKGSRLLEKGGSERAKVASASRRPERVSHQPTSTRRVTSLVDPET